MVDLGKYLSENSYPGRGIAVARSADGADIFAAYFIMGRSVNSRNRVFAETDNGVKTKAFDESKLSDPSLVIYQVMKDYKNKIFITNGDQTDTVYENAKIGRTFADALRTRGYEPDEPNFTPRISAEIELGSGFFKYKLSILKKAENNASCNRFFFEYDKPAEGTGHIIHTYKSDGEPIPSFDGEPVAFAVSECFEDFGETVWSALDSDNKVSLLVRKVNIATGVSELKIYNKNTEY